MALPVDQDDLELLGAGIVAALADADGPAAAESAVFGLGWADLLAASPWQAAALAGRALGATWSGAALLDDVLTAGLGAAPSSTTCVVLPPPHRWSPPARRAGTVTIDGMATGRIDRATDALVAMADDGAVRLVTVDAAALRPPVAGGLDPAGGWRRVRIELSADALAPVATEGSWEQAVALGRATLAHQLVTGAGAMLEMARAHALDRHQFGHPIAAYQAVRHHLANALIAIEGAEAVAAVCEPGVDPLVPAVAKSRAGRAARDTASHAQQVLGGIGFTAEHPFPRRLARTLVVDTVLGSSRSLPGEIGAELLRRGRAPRLIEL